MVEITKDMKEKKNNFPLSVLILKGQKKLVFIF